jgi:tRNA U34 5-methylaminomethyl-2-thiouridine-forming methyltransferase MnmC
LGYFSSETKGNPILKRIIEATGDGSKTIFIPELDERYHSKHGALQEALHVFIEMGLKHLDKSELHILEIGFGTGLNALLTFKESVNSKQQIKYTGLEAFPVALDMAMQMDYCSNSSDKEMFEKMHQSSWNEWHGISNFFSLNKQEQKLENFETKDHFDIIYFDAFGPRVQEEMWGLHVFEKMFALLNSGGILCTYCAKGSVRRNMIAAGFLVERLPGPPGKREMLRAIKP